MEALAMNKEILNRQMRDTSKHNLGSASSKKR